MTFFPGRFPAFLQAVLLPVSLCFAGPEFHLISAGLQSPVAGASLCVSAPDTCLFSDDSGHIVLGFSAPDSAAYRISAPGHQDTTVTCSADGTMTIAMRPFEVNDRSLEIVVVAPSADRSEDAYRQSTVLFTPGDIKTQAGAAQDIGRYISTLPSTVSSLSKDFDNTFFVRGGRPSENIFLVDGIEMENIDHFSKINGSGGPIGFINAGNVRTVGFNAGTMSVHYPSRMSSVVDIVMKNGSMNKAKQTMGFEIAGGGIGGIIAAEGPLVRGKSSYVFSARYLDFEPMYTTLQKSFNDAGMLGPPKVGDIYGRVFLLTDDNLDFSATGILSYNKYGYPMPRGGLTDRGAFFWNALNQDERIFQGGTGITAHYAAGALAHEVHAAFSFRNGVRSDSLSSFTDTFFTGQYAANPVSTDKDYRKRYTVSARSALSLFEHDTLSAGARASINDYRFYRSDESQYQDMKCYVCDANGNRDSVYASKASVAGEASVDNEESNISVEYKSEWGMLRGTFGVRGDYFSLLDDVVASPRFSFSLKTASAGVFSGSLGCYRQFPTELPFQVFDFYYWVFTDTPRDTLRRVEKTLLRQAQPSRCWQTSIGYDKFLWGAVETRIEAYFKWYDREYHYLGPAYQEVFCWNNEGKLALQKQDGKRRAYGIEGRIGNPDYKGFFYSLSASLFDVKNLYHDGTWYDDWTAVRYTYSLSLGACFFNDHTLSFSARGSDGRPYCPQMIMFDCWNNPYPVNRTDAYYYSGRLEKIICANMRYSFTRNIGGFRVESFVEILNLLNYKPTLEYQFNGINFTEIKPFGRIPMAGCSVQW
jgi:hypothetical protein